MPESEQELLSGAQSPEQVIREESQGRHGYETSHLWVLMLTSTGSSDVPSQPRVTMSNEITMGDFCDGAVPSMKLFSNQ